ncbi:hypothetical protein KSP40_PGU003289 [Platanthera guangdongensis]|uniref:Uncharacterized protein n=1 Tax=Platanthera guangdongensis TaxID=2320717 RepID=A0ABR2MCN7_9ASPA
MEDDAQIAQRTALQDAFGEDSDSSDEALSPFIEETKLYTWESVEGIDGLWLCRDFLLQKHQNLVLSAIDRDGWFNETSHNQAMRFGDLPVWATELTRMVRKAVCFGEIAIVDGLELDCEDQLMEESGPLPFDLLWREPLFDQLIVNVYQPGEVRCEHFFLCGNYIILLPMKFIEQIGMPCTPLRLEDLGRRVPHRCTTDPGVERLEEEGDIENGSQDWTRGGTQRSKMPKKGNVEDDSPAKVPVMLNPGSLILMSGEARYSWKHEINRADGFQIWKGREILQQRRTSVTLRKLCPSPNDL